MQSARLSLLQRITTSIDRVIFAGSFEPIHDWMAWQLNLAIFRRIKTCSNLYLYVNGHARSSRRRVNNRGLPLERLTAANSIYAGLQSLELGYATVVLAHKANAMLPLQRLADKFLSP